MKIIKNIFSFILIMSLVTSSLCIPTFAEENTLPEKSTWAIEVSSKFGNCERSAIDGNLKTYWHSYYEVEGGVAVNPDPVPYYVYVTFPSETVFSGVDITPRADEGAHINEVSVYVSDNATNNHTDESWVLVAENATFATPKKGDQTPFSIDFGTNVKAKKMMFVITKTSNRYGTIAEIDLHEKNIMYPVAPVSELLLFNSIKNDDSALSDKSNWKISVNSGPGSIKKAIDGIVAEDNYWHSYFEATGPEITYRDTPPYYVYLTFPEKTVISKLDIIPRQDSKNGCPLKLSIFGSLSDTAVEGDEDMILLEEDLKYEAGNIGRIVDIAENIVVRKLLIKITASNGGYGCISEINIEGYDPEKGYSSLESYIDTAEFVRRYQISPNFFEIESDYEGIWSTHYVGNMIDGSGSTFWQTDSLVGKNIKPTVTVDMQEEYILSEFEYYPRQTEDFHGLWRKFTLRVSDNGTNYKTIGTYEFPETLDRKCIKLPEATKCRYVQFYQITGNYNYVGGAELYLYQNWEGYNDYNTRYGGTFHLEYGSEEVYCEKGANPGDYTLDGPVIVRDGWTFVPLKSFANQLIYKGAATEDTSSDLRKLTVSLNNGLKTFTLQDNNHLVYSDDNNYGEVRYTMYALPFVEDGVFYAPLHFLCEIIGYDASMDYESGVLTLVKEDFNMYDTIEWIDPAKAISEYTVNYNLGEEGYGVIKGDSLSSNVLIGKSIALPEVEAKVGYEFDGWYYPGRIKKLAGMGSDSYTPEGDVTLYAVYTEIEGLDEIKADSISRLKATDLNLYRTAERKKIEAAIARAETEILSAENIEDVETFYNAAKDEIDSYETDEEMTKAEDEQGIKLTITGTSGGQVLLNEEPVSGTVIVAAGNIVTLKAVKNEDGGAFKAWIDGNTKKILSIEETYEFAMHSKRHIIALFTDKTIENSVFTSFVTRNNQFIKYAYVEKGTDTNTIAPDAKNLYVSGYEFKGWNPELGIINKNTDYKALYEDGEELYSVSVIGGEEIDNGREFTATYNTVFVVKADEAPLGLKFAGWKLNGQLVSCEEEFSFAVFGDIVLEATYAKSAVKKPLVVMLDVTEAKKEDYNLASFMGDVYVPEGCTLVEAGILYAKTFVEPGDLILSKLGERIDGKEIKRTITYSETMFKLSASYSEDGITGRAYLIYLDESGEKRIIYTDAYHIEGVYEDFGNGGIDEDLDFN